MADIVASASNRVLPVKRRQEESVPASDLSKTPTAAYDDAVYLSITAGLKQPHIHVRSQLPMQRMVYNVALPLRLWRRSDGVTSADDQEVRVR
jgi:hypothetical protein